MVNIKKSMAENKSKFNARGLSILGTIQIVFVILYFTDTGTVAEWPLVYVFMPLIIQAALIVLACCCAAAVFAASSSKPNNEINCPI